MRAAPPVVVTRPEEAGRRLAAQLAAAGFDALWLPAFDLGPAPEPALIARTLARLPEFDLAIFVSPAAVRATGAALGLPWPEQTAVAAVGAATARALREYVTAAPTSAPIVAEGEGESGSEALWAALQARPALPRRALVLRAQTGREWLLDRLRAAGTAVEALAVYSRSPHGAGSADLDWLRSRAAGGLLASVVTSSEAVAVLASQLAAQPATLAALRAGPALASHPRIAARLRGAGHADVRLCAPNVADIVACLHGSGASPGGTATGD